MALRIGKAQKYKQHIYLKRKMWLIMLQDSDLVICVSVVQDQKRKLGYTTKSDHLACLLADGWDSLALRMVNKFVISTSPCSGVRTFLKQVYC